MFSFKKSKPNDEFLSQVFEHQGIIHKVCNLYSDTPDDRKDLFQDMMLQLWRAYSSFKGDSKFSTWMYQVCLNTALYTLKKNKKRSLFTSLEEVKKEPFFETQNSFEINIELKFLHNAISNLTEIERAIILLYIEEKSYDEIGQIIGINVSNVGAKISRIKRKLEFKLKSEKI